MPTRRGQADASVQVAGSSRSRRRGRRRVRRLASPAALLKGPGDTLVRTKVHAGTNGLQYVAYERTYRGLPVVGGDAVVVTDAAGAVLNTAVAQDSVITVATTATVERGRGPGHGARPSWPRSSRAIGSAPGRAGLGHAAAGLGDRGRRGATATAPSKLHVFVDALTGKVADSYDEVRAGTGNGFYNGTVTISTSGSGSSFSMQDSTRPGIRCGGQNGATFTGTDDAWGNGSGTNLETACVDALYARAEGMGHARRVAGPQRHQRQRRRLPGPGRPQPGQRVLERQLHQLRPQLGRTPSAGHADGRGGARVRPRHLPDHPGRRRAAATRTAASTRRTGDIFGALTEAFANNPNDPPDFLVGEEVNLVGTGPIRNMYNPSALGDPNCWSTAIPNTEVHAAAGPLNHWFYLLAAGLATRPAARPARPATARSVTGVGIQNAGQIYYNAMLAKTSTWRYANVRLASLNAAVNLFGAQLAPCATVKARLERGLRAGPGRRADLHRHRATTSRSRSRRPPAR